MQFRPIAPTSAATAALHYSPAILVEGQRLPFISGQSPQDLYADPDTQIRETFKQIAAILVEAGASWKNVVMVRAYFLDMARDLPAFRKIRQDFLVEPFPAATVVGVTELAVPNLQVEIEAVAVL